MVDKEHMIKLANRLHKETDLSFDLILANCKLTHREYRKVHPDAPMTTGLILDLLDAKMTMSNDTIKKRWNLTQSQLNYALYNDKAIAPVDTTKELVVARIVKELQGGKKTQTKIAQEYNVSQSFVHKIAKEHNLLPKYRKERIKLSKIQKEEIAKEIKQGTSVDSLAKKYNVSRDTIYKYLRSICE